MNDSADEGDSNETHACPIPMAHDRFEEAHWFLHQMLDKYHHPDLFRYSTNAFLSALKSVLEMLRTELGDAGHKPWMKQKFDEIKKDPVLSRFNEGRNIVIHHRSIVKGSRVQSGLFRNYDLKLAMQADLSHDASSESILRFIQTKMVGFIIDEDHGAIGEQLGVRRMYYVPELSDEEDVLTASHRRMTSAMRAPGASRRRPVRTCHLPYDSHNAIRGAPTAVTVRGAVPPAERCPSGPCGIPPAAPLTMPRVLFAAALWTGTARIFTHLPWGGSLRPGARLG